MAGVGGPRRPGIVHRLDKGTSGLIVLAKTQAAYESLTAQLARRTVVPALPLPGPRPREAARPGVIDAAIGRDPRSRVRMAVAREGRGKRAVTRFQVLERLGDCTLPSSAGSRPAAPTRSACTWPRSASRSWATRPTAAAARGRLAARAPRAGRRARRRRAPRGRPRVRRTPRRGPGCELVSPLPHRIGNLLSYLRHMARLRPADGSRA